MTQMKTLDVEAIRKDFPILARTVHGKPLVYLDNAASAQKPRCVIDAIRHVYEHEYSNVHRAAHELSAATTEKFEHARRAVQAFLNAREDREIIFTRGTTEAINLVAQAWGRANVSAGDEILITAMEHHSNIVPWQMLCQATGAKLVVAPMDDTGTLILDEYVKRLSPRTRLVACVQVSNALGTINPVAQMAQAAHKAGALILVDGAQAAPHQRIDVQALGVDFYAFSGHKAYGPTGIGALWGRAELLEAMPPWQGGGEMIKSVSFEQTTYNVIPHKFEAGTPNIADAIGLAAGLEYLAARGMDAIEAYEHELLEYATAKVREIPGLRIIGTSARKAGVISFVLEGIHAADAGMILDQQGIAVRVGQHCAEPVMDFFKVRATVRASFAFYNTRAEADVLAAGIRKVQELFS
ncbi:MAG: cysteine desulfurase [Planctomycetes bacterium]|nr:cysteine desulfurase [Planctomycetota bacterium]MCW8136313.1 cysteine desulfurase [Planctomycetota bacterium]